jgi:hypothetical protein
MRRRDDKRTGDDLVKAGVLNDTARFHVMDANTDTIDILFHQFMFRFGVFSVIFRIMDPRSDSIGISSSIVDSKKAFSTRFTHRPWLVDDGDVRRQNEAQTRQASVMQQEREFGYALEWLQGYCKL